MKTNIFKDDQYEKVILQAGREGRHLTYFLDILGISFTEHDRMVSSSKKYANIIKEYEKLCEEYWYNMAYTSMTENQGQGFNTRLWTVIMKNKFSERWNDTNKVDLTTKGDKLDSLQNIQIEVVKKIVD